MEESFWRTLFDVHFVIAILTIIYYSWILLLMYSSTSPVFRSAFYRIFMVTGFFDVQSIVVIEWIRADRRLGFGPDYEIFTRIMYTFTFSHFFIHIIGCFLMTLNRYMAVCHPLSYKKCWSARAVNIILFVDIFLSIIVHTQLFLVELGYQWQNNKWVYIGRLKPIPVMRMMTTCVVFIYEVANISLTFLIICSITKLGKTARTEKFWKEMALLTVLAIECSLGALECYYEVVGAFDFGCKNSPVFTWMSSNYSLYFFVLVSMNSYGTMIMSSELRKEVVVFFCKVLRYEVDAANVHRVVPTSITLPSQQLSSTLLHNKRFQW